MSNKQAVEKITLTNAHVIATALLVAFAVAVGTYALTRTTQLGLKSKSTATQSGSNLARWTRELNRADAALRKALTEVPPRIPAPGQPISFVPPQPIIVTVHVPGPSPVAPVAPSGEGGRGD